MTSSADLGLSLGVSAGVNAGASAGTSASSSSSGVPQGPPGTVWTPFGFVPIKSAPAAPPPQAPSTPAAPTIVGRATFNPYAAVNQAIAQAAAPQKVISLGLRTVLPTVTAAPTAPALGPSFPLTPPAPAPHASLLAPVLGLVAGAGTGTLLSAFPFGTLLGAAVGLGAGFGLGALFKPKAPSFSGEWVDFGFDDDYGPSLPACDIGCAAPWKNLQG